MSDTPNLTSGDLEAPTTEALEPAEEAGTEESNDD